MKRIFLFHQNIFASNVFKGAYIKYVGGEAEGFTNF